MTDEEIAQQVTVAILGKEIVRAQMDVDFSQTSFFLALKLLDAFSHEVTVITGEWGTRIMAEINRDFIAAGLAPVKFIAVRPSALKSMSYWEVESATKKFVGGEF